METKNSIQAIIFFWVFLMIFLFSCTNKKSTYYPIKECFEKIEKNIKNDKALNHMKTCSLDSLTYVFPIFKREFEKIQEKTDCNRQIEDFFDLHSIPNNPVLRDEVLILAFQKYLNQYKIDLNEIQDEIKGKKLIKVKREKIEEQKLLGIIRENNSNWSKGDTIDIVLQLSGKGDRKQVFYRHHSLAYDYSTADDSLNIRGVLIDKQYDSSETISETEKTLSLIFKIKILELSDTNAYAVDRLKIEDIFDLDLASYGRFIE